MQLLIYLQFTIKVIYYNKNANKPIHLINNNGQ